VSDAEIIQLGSHGRPGRGSRSAPSAAARGLAPGAAQQARRGVTPPPAEPVAEAPDTEFPPSRPAAGKQGVRPQSRKSPQKGPGKPSSADSAPPPGSDQAPSQTTAPKEAPDQSDPTAASVDQSDPTAASVDQSDPTAASVDQSDPTAASVGQSDPTADATGESQVPPAIDLGALLSEFASTASLALQALRSAPVEQLRQFAVDPLRGVLGLAEMLGVNWQESLEEIVEFARSRLRGDYSIDEFGFDPEFTTKVFLPLLRPLVQNWFRVEVRGLENIPETGSALLVSNHAGTMPLDGMVLHTVVFDEMARHVRMLGADLIFSTPYAHDLARKTGTTLACQEDAERLLASDQLVAVFPEGFKGLGKPYADRYKLQRFGRGGFVSAAVRAQVPIIPVSIVGSEEIYPLISGLPTLARALGIPYFPVTPLFPWLGALGLIPLPSKWIIQFGEAIATDELPPGAADDPMVVFNVTDQVRETIQHTLYALLMQRRSAFF
jgi:1-acyl-sn-glycerol-3-phosphate acyltransferase